MSDESVFDQLRKTGATPLDLAKVANARGLSIIESVKLLLFSFPLQLVEAKDIATQAHYGMGLSEYQEKYILPILEELEKEGFFEP